MKLIDILEKFSDKQVMSLYNPDSETYRNSTSGGRIANSKSISKKDITVKGTRVDFPTGSYDADQFDTVTRAELTKEIHAAIDQLPRRNALILKAHFGIEPFSKPMTKTQIAKVIGLSDTRIMQIIAKSLKLLRDPKIARKLRSFASEAENQQQPSLPIDLNKINNLIDKLESRGVSPEDADKMRREVQLLATPRQSMHPEVILQLLTILVG